MSEPTTERINVFNALAVLLQGLADSLEASAALRSPLPRWVRIARGRIYKQAALGGIVTTGTRALCTGIESLQDLTYKAEELLIQGDSLVALGEVGINVVKEVSKPEFQNALTTGIGVDASALSALNALNQPLTTVETYMDKVPTEEDLWSIKSELYRLLCIQFTAEGKLDLAASGKVRLLRWAYLDNNQLDQALGVRSLTAASLEQTPKYIYEQTTGTGAVVSVEVISMDFGTNTPDKTAAIAKLTQLGFGSTGSSQDIKDFQAKYGFETAAQSGALDVRTINALLGLDTKAKMIAKPKPKA